MSDDTIRVSLDTRYSKIHTFSNKIVTSGLSSTKHLFKIIRSILEAFFRLVKDENLLAYSGLRMPIVGFGFSRIWSMLDPAHLSLQ